MPIRIGYEPSPTVTGELAYGAGMGQYKKWLAQQQAEGAARSASLRAQAGMQERALEARAEEEAFQREERAGAAQERTRQWEAEQKTGQERWQGDLDWRGREAAAGRAFQERMAEKGLEERNQKRRDTILGLKSVQNEYYRLDTALKEAESDPKYDDAQKKGFRMVVEQAKEDVIKSKWTSLEAQQAEKEEKKAEEYRNEIKSENGFVDAEGKVHQSWKKKHESDERIARMRADDAERKAAETRKEAQRKEFDAKVETAEKEMNDAEDQFAVIKEAEKKVGEETRLAHPPESEVYQRAEKKARNAREKHLIAQRNREAARMTEQARRRAELYELTGNEERALAESTLERGESATLGLGGSVGGFTETPASAPAGGANAPAPLPANASEDQWREHFANAIGKRPLSTGSW